MGANQPMTRLFVRLAVVAALLTATLSALADQTRVTDVVYGHKLGMALTMDVFKPEKPNGIGIVWMVSGGWVSNHDSINPEIARAFTNRGMTMFQVCHGSAPRFTVAEAVADVSRAVRFIRTRAADWGVDPNKLAACGGSAGGHLSLMMGCCGGPGPADAKDPVDRASSRVQAVACFYPPCDFLNYYKEGQRAIDNPLLKSFWPAFGVDEKTTPERKIEIAREISPIYGVSKETPPTLIIHGDADLLVPIQQSKLIMAKFKEMGVPSNLQVRPGKAHGWPGIEAEATTLADWVEKYLKK